MGQKLEDVQPRRVALVKRGANLRRILLAKAGEVDADIAELLAAPVAKEAELLDAVREAHGDESVQKAAAAYARIGDALIEAFGGSLPEPVLKATRRQMDQMHADDESGDNNDGDTLDGDANEGAGEGDTDEDVAKAYESVLKRTFTADQRKKLAASGAAMSNGSYPIENRDDLQNAIHAIGRGKSPHSEIKAHIIARAKSLGATDLLPDDWKVSKDGAVVPPGWELRLLTKEDRMTETAQAVPVKKDDGTWDLSAVPEDNRAAVEAVIKAHEDEVAELRKAAEAEASKAEEALAKAEAVEEKIAKAEYVSKSAGYDNLAKADDEFGDILYAIAKAERDKHLPEGTSEKLDAVLKAANEAAKDLFVEAGRAGSGNGSGEALAKVENIAKALRDADPALTKEQAFAKAIDQNPDLYTEIKKEQA